MKRAAKKDGMATGARLALAVLFAGIVLLSGLRFYSLRYSLDFTDEDDHTTIGWLLTKGETLYGSVFSHHMPLPYLTAQIVASLSPTDHPAHFRAVPWLVYAAVAAALALSPLVRGQPAAACLAGSAYLVLVTITVPPFLGHLLLADNLAGCGLAIAFALVILPVLIGAGVRPLDAAAGGAALGFALAASPTAIFPAAAAVVGMGATTMFRRPCEGLLSRVVLPGVTGATAALAAVAIWLARFGSLRGFVEEVVRFNRRFYTPFALGPDEQMTGGVLRRMAREWLNLLAGSASVPDLHRRIVFASILLAVVASVSAGFLAARRAAVPPSRVPMVTPLLNSTTLLAIFVLSAPRGFNFRALPFLILVCASGALIGAAALAESPSLGRAAVFLAVPAPLLVLSLQDGINRIEVRSPLTWPYELRAVADHIRTHTSPDERIAAFPSAPRVYLETKRLPATDSVFFLPWQAKWEESRPLESSTCAQLRRARPRYVVINPERIWDLWPWAGYGACIDQFAKENYTKLPDERFGGLLWERTDVSMEESAKAGRARPGTTLPAVPGTE